MSRALILATTDDNIYLSSNIFLMNTRIDNTILNIIIQKSNRDINISDSGSISTITLKYDNLNKINGFYKGIYNLYNQKKYDITITYKLRSCFYNYIYLISAYYAYHKIIEAYNVYNTTNSSSPISFNNYIDIYINQHLLSNCAANEKAYYNDVIKHIKLYNSSRINEAKKILIINYYRNLLLFGLHKFERISTAITDVLWSNDSSYNNPIEIINRCIINTYLDSNFTETAIKNILDIIYKKNQEIVKRYPLITSDQYITIPQYEGVCWFISTISGMCYSELSRKLILSKIIDNFGLYRIEPSNDYIYSELNKHENENLSSIYRKFVLFVYYIIINLTYENKKYIDFTDNQELLIKILTQLKTFPEYFLTTILELTVKPNSSSISTSSVGSKRKTIEDDKDDEDNEYNYLINDIKNYTINSDYIRIYHSLLERSRNYRYKNIEEINRLIELNKQTSSKKIRSVPDVPDVHPDVLPDVPDLDISASLMVCTSVQSIEDIIKTKREENEELNKMITEINKIYIEQLNTGLVDEDLYFITNKRDGKFGASKGDYNILTHFYSYLNITVLFLYLDNDAKNIYFPKNAPSLNNISDYDVIIISRLSLKVLLPINQDAFFNIQTDRDSESNRIFDDVDNFMLNFRGPPPSFIIPTNISLTSESEIKFELDYILHSSTVEFSHANCGHCTSSFRYPTGTDYVSHNSSHINNIIQASNIKLRIPNILIKNDWYSQINTDNKYAILQGYIKPLNVKDYYYKISHQADQEAVYYSYDTDIRYVYVKKNNLDNLSGDVNAKIQQVKGVVPMAVEGGNKNKSQKNNLMRNIKSNNFFSRLRI